MGSGILFLIGGMLAFAAAVAGICWIERRKFNRRNRNGVEGFSSYGDMMTNRLIEGAAKVGSVIIGTVGIVGIAVGIFTTF